MELLSLCVDVLMYIGGMLHPNDIKKAMTTCKYLRDIYEKLLNPGLLDYIHAIQYRKSHALDFMDRHKFNIYEVYAYIAMFTINTNNRNEWPGDILFMNNRYKEKIESGARYKNCNVLVSTITLKFDPPSVFRDLIYCILRELTTCEGDTKSIEALESFFTFGILSGCGNSVSLYEVKALVTSELVNTFDKNDKFQHKITTKDGHHYIELSPKNRLQMLKWLMLDRNVYEYCQRQMNINSQYSHLYKFLFQKGWIETITGMFSFLFYK